MKRVGLILIGVVSLLGLVSDGLDLGKDLERIKGEFNRLLEKIDEQYQLTGNQRILALKGRALLEFGRFSEAKEAFSKCNLPECKKGLALAYYHLGDYTHACAIWERLDLDGDWESIYYYALACERLNLYPQAKRLLASIPRGSEFYGLAQAELRKIEEESTTISFADLFPEDVIKDIHRATPQNYPQAGSVVIREVITTRVTTDKRMIQRVYVLRKILNERGKEEHGEVIITYDSTYETVKILRARTITPDGRVVNVGKKHIRDVSLYKNFPLYSNARARIISMPELVPGALIEYEVEVQDNKLLADEHLVYYIWPQGKEPVLYQSDTLILPKEMRLRYRDVNLRYNDFGAVFEPLVKREGEEVRMQWTFKDVPQVIPEPGMPSLINSVPIRVYSSFGSWDQIYEWWWNLAKDKIVVDDKIRAKVKELIKGKDSDWEKAKAIYHYCASQIRYVAVEYGKAGYEPHPAPEIFANKYGDCKDQAILLVSMLREAGIKRAYPVIIPTRDILDMDPRFPSVMFNHAIAVVEVDGKKIYMDPTAQTCGFGDLPPSDQGRGVLIYTDDRLILDRTPIFAPEHNQVIVRTRLLPREGEVKGIREVLARGALAMGQRYWLKYSMPESVRQTLEAKAKEILPDATILDYQVENLDELDKDVVLKYRFVGRAGIFLSAGPYRIVPIYEGISLADVVKDKRRYPLQKLAPMVRKYVYQFVLPYEIEPVYLPDRVSIDNDWFTYRMEYTVRKEGENSILEEKVEFVQKVMEISPEDYPRYKEAKQDLSARLRERGLIKIKEN